ncbi:MAG: radical SAM protein [Candidatus Solibacter sp.]|jgi:MoaA/NifB/PqqE/SkfB family radical SAM enzyme
MIGYVDEANALHIRGWAADPDDFQHTLNVEVLIDGSVVATAAAGHCRPDLEHAGFGTGHHGFDCTLPVLDLRRGDVDFQVRIQGTDVVLPFGSTCPSRLDLSIFIDVLAVDIVNNCNLRCPFCMVDYSGVDKTELMTEETFLSLLRLMPHVPDGGFWLSCLHEPTLHPRMDRFLSLIPSDSRKKVVFTTNLARPLPEKTFESWAASGLKHINISFDTINPDLFAVLRKFGKYSVFENNLRSLVRAFQQHANPPLLRYITTAFRSSAGEIPVLVRRCHEEFLASECEIRSVYNTQNIPDDFRQSEFLRSSDWSALTAAMANVPYRYNICYPHDNQHVQVVAANRFDFDPPDEELQHFIRPLYLRARPDGTLRVAESEFDCRFRVNVHDLEDPARFFYDRLENISAGWLRGHIEEVNPDSVIGRALDRNDLTRSLIVELWLNGQLSATARTAAHNRFVFPLFAGMVPATGKVTAQVRVQGTEYKVPFRSSTRFEVTLPSS